jgi:hypothetical protein
MPTNRPIINPQNAPYLFKSFAIILKNYSYKFIEIPTCSFIRSKKIANTYIAQTGGAR